MTLLPDDRSRASRRQTGLNHRAACHDPRRGEGWRRPDYPICAIARTSEAKALGIRMGEPYFKIRDMCRSRGVRVFSSNYALYGDMSARTNAVYRTFARDVEIYSIDESFLDLSDVRGQDRLAL
ncbi:hypothetical protein FV285_23545, partial [Escherichia coli]